MKHINSYLYLCLERVHPHVARRSQHHSSSHCLKINHNVCKAAKSHFVIDSSSYIPEKLSLTCRWFEEGSRERRDFLELLDDMSFKLVMFYTDVIYGGDSSMTQIPLFKKLDFQSLYEKSLALLASSVLSIGENGPKWVASPRNLVFCDLGGKVKHFRPKVTKDGPPNSRKFFAFGTSKEPQSKNVSAKSKTKVALTGPTCRIKSSQAFASSSAPKHTKYLDISSSSEEDQSTNGVVNDKKSSEDLKATESSNSSVVVDNDVGSSDRSDNKVIGGYNFDEVNIFHNDDA
ncbi:transcription factor bHLH77-like [Pyrus ussuriensis x Pyrus communis]|uniref:Transcription factor bHLH77-like n=1 Tax=Pyrus ussuriensis x Pyrus communis TaxID=2448454 RepID=A0A5N5FXB2_9ROSA|nr:transcription factor bHLH77-like [Pyrus ussuriensis x Pyrus communis]